MNEIVGYIINESAIEAQELNIVKEKKDSIVSEAILQDFDRNRNRRRYSESRLVEGLQAPHIQEMLKANSWYGESGHPLSDDVKRQMRIERSNASHRILSYTHNPGKNITGIIETSMYPVGIALREEMRHGHIPSYSMRGMSAVKKLVNGDIDVDGPVKILTYDVVTFPSHKTAYQTRILSEQTDFINESSAMLQDNGDILIPLSESTMMEFLNATSETVKKTLEALEVTESKRLVLFEAFGRILIEEDGRNRIILQLEKELTSSKAYMDHLVSLRGK